MIYDLEYFIAKFEAIPEDQWTIGEFVSEDECRKCAFGHCGQSGKIYRKNEESEALRDISNMIAVINDGNRNATHEFGSTPKQRVVNFLKHLRK